MKVMSCQTGMTKSFSLE